MSLDDFSFSEEGSEGISGNKEVSKEVLEKFRENSKKASSQAKRDKKQEIKQKKEEDQLIKVIIQFLQNSQYSGFFILISKVGLNNVPSDFLLAILSLIHKESFYVVNGSKIEFKQPPKQKSEFPKDITILLSQWQKLVFSVASSKPHKVLETILDHDWKTDESLIQLMSFIIREFFKYKKFSVPFENINNFSKVFLENISLELEKQINKQKTLN
jgi:hypothetical protein